MKYLAVLLVFLPLAISYSSAATGRLYPEDVTYLGAFRLPGDGERPASFAYGGEAMTYFPGGNPSGGTEHLPGSLFIMGHNRMPYGELPDGNQVAEVAIPIPKISQSVDRLPQAQFIQSFRDIAKGWFAEFDEIPRCAMEYYNSDAAGEHIHLGWGQHYHDEQHLKGPTHGWFSLDLNSPDMQGPWYIGEVSHYSINNYLFSIPQDWADTHTGGRVLAAGRFRDGGWSGMGPSLYAYRPWNEGGVPAESGQRLEEIVLLQYASSLETMNIEHAMEGYQHGDEWEGGAWIVSPSGKQAVVFAGTKSVGQRYWYGFIHPQSPELPCLQEEFIGEFVLCRNSDGTPCGQELDMVCSNPASGRGWWSDRFSAQCIFYDPDDFARVLSGELEPWEPQPYASLCLDDHLFMNPSRIDEYEIGSAQQRRYRIGDVAYDRDSGLLYILELFGDGAKPVVHVWSIQ